MLASVETQVPSDKKGCKGALIEEQHIIAESAAVVNGRVTTHPVDSNVESRTWF